MDRYPANESSETDLDVDEGKALLKVHNEGRIEVEFEKAADRQNPKIKPTSRFLDPKVVNFAPKEIYGIVKSRDESKRWEVSVPLMFNSPVGPGIGVTGTVGADFQTTKDHRMEIQGNLLQDDDHDEGANGLTWDLTENEAQRDGSLRHFTGIVVVQYQPGEAFWMKVSVKPAVKFSIDPRRLMQKEDVLQRLFQRNDDPILLDGETPLKGQVDLHCDDFSSEKFPWENVLQLPKEYENQLVMDPA